MTNLNGILLIDKPQGWTSADVVRKVVKLTNGAKVGQMGTLDPLATGVLPVSIGRATKLFDIFLKKDKEYIGTFTWGKSTNTQDITGEVDEQNDFVPTKESLLTAIQKFVGNISQMPPAFSAKKVNGVPAYMLARKKYNVELKPKEITIYSIELLDYNNESFTLDIVCSSGTYIRTLGVDIAKECGALATMSALKRTRTGNFLLQDCHQMQDIDADNIVERIISIDTTLAFLPVLALNQEDFYALKDGKILSTDAENGLYRAKYNDILLGIVEISGKKVRMNTYLFV